MSYRIVFAAVIASLAAGIAHAEPSEPAADANTNARAVDPRVRSLLDRLPLAYEANLGQAPEDYDFLVRCRGYHAFVSSSEAVFSFDGAALRMSLDGAACAEPETQGLELPGKANYLLGDDAANWVTEIPLTRGAVYRDAAPGTTWTFGGRGRALEFEFVLDPGVQGPSLRLDGAVSAKVADDGSLRIEMPRGVARMSAPVAWQDLPDRRLPAVARWVAAKDGIVRIEVAARDPSRRVHVDPTVTYESYLGGTNSDWLLAAAMDASASAYVAGYTYSTNFPTTQGAFSTSLTPGVNGSRTDAFVVKMNASGSALAYATYIGGSSDEYANSIQVDGSGNAYVVGTTNSTNFPVTPGAYRSGTGGEGYVLSLNAAGSSLRFSTCTLRNFGMSVAIGPYGGAYVIEGGELAFYSSLGSQRDFGTSITASTPGGGFNAVASDISGNAYVVGNISLGSAWPATFGAYRNTIGGSGEALVTKVDSSGNVIWTTYLGGSGGEEARLVGVNNSGQAYVIGTTASSDFPVTSGALASTRTGSNDWFLTRFDATASSLRYSTYAGGIALNSLRVHQYSSWVCGGSVNAASSVTASGGFQLQSGGGNEGFVLKFNRDNTLAWSSFVGGSGDESVDALGMAPDGSVVLAGTTSSTNLPTVSPYQGTNQTSPEGFLLVVPDSLPTSVAAPVVAESVLPAATISGAYAHGIVATGGISPYVWSYESGTIPPGLSIAADGQLTGTPTQTGTFFFRVQVVDASDRWFAGGVNLTVNPVPSLPGAVLGTTIGTQCDRQVPVSGGTPPYSIELLAGTMPGGLMFGANGHLTGTATTLGDTPLTIKATDAYGLTATGGLTIRVHPLPSISDTPPPAATTTLPYAFTFTTEGGTAPFTWTALTAVATLPSALSPSGFLSGFAKPTGTYEFLLRATDAVGAVAERSFSVDVHAKPQIETLVLRPMTTGRPFAQVLGVTGGTPPFTWAPGSGDFPVGFQVVPATGRFWGTPLLPGPGSALIRCTDRWGAESVQTVSFDAAMLSDLTHKKSTETLVVELGGANVVTRAVELTAGSSLGVTLSGGRVGETPPKLEVRDSAGTPIDLAALIRTTKKTVGFKGLVVAETGRYFVTAKPAANFTGKVKLTIAIAPRSTWAAGGALDADDPSEFRFAAPPGAFVTIVAKAAKGSAALPRIVSVTGPDATDLVPGGKTVEKGASAKFSSKVPLAGGDYLVEFATRDGTPGEVTWTVKLKLPRKYEFEMPDVPAGD